MKKEGMPSHHIITCFTIVQLSLYLKLMFLKAQNQSVSAEVLSIFS